MCRQLLAHGAVVEKSGQSISPRLVMGCVQIPRLRHRIRRLSRDDVQEFELMLRELESADPQKHKDTDSLVSLDERRQQHRLLDYL